MLGQCLKLTDMTTDQVGPGTWNAAAGTYSTTLPSKGTCGGGGDGADTSTLHLVASACGTLRFTVVAQGYQADTLSANIQIFWSGGEPLFLYGPNDGGTDPCEVATMRGTTVCEIPVTCGTDVYIQYGRAIEGADAGEITATVTVEVV